MILSRVRLLPQERYDLEDFLSQQSGARTDSKFWTKHFLSDQNFILKGFTVSGLGLTEATVNMSNATLINAANSTDFSWYTSELNPANIVIPASSLTDGVKNYVEIKLATETNTPITKAFWDAAANGGLGSEFNQQIDTQTDLVAEIVVQTGGFSGNPDRIQLAIIEVNGLGTITGILDRRNLFFRLGTASNPNNTFTWVSQEESDITLTLSSVVGSFTTGETVTFSGGATATVTQGGTTTIKVTLPSSTSFAVTNTVTGGSSGATATLDQYLEDFTGGDKDITNFRKMYEALTTEILAVKGTDFWYQQAVGSLSGLFSQINSILVQTSVAGNARFSWTGSALSITDDSGAPDNADVLAELTILGTPYTYEITRQDGTGGSTTISLFDGEVCFIQIPNNADRTFSGVGATAVNYQVVAVEDFVRSDANYWLAFRKGTKLYLRGLGELEAGESHQISDETPGALKTFLGFDPETATVVPYSVLPNVGLSGQFTTSSSLVDAISANAENINNIDDILNTNTYEETREIVAAAPTGNQLLGPVLAGTSVFLPVDSRDSNNNEFYIVGAGILEIYLNGRYLRSGVDYNEVGVAGNPSNELTFTYDLVVDDELTFRQDATGGIFSTSSGLDTLQDVYNNGRTITTLAGQPVEISGPVSEKLLVVNGDVEITGVIDPKGITFTREASNPLTAFAMDGLWIDSSGDLQSYKHGVGNVNITSIASGGAGKVTQDLFTNGTLSTINKGTPVSMNSSGEIEPTDITSETSVDGFIGIAAENIGAGVPGNVAMAGRLENITTSISFGSAVFVDTTGALTSTKPSVGVGGFDVGDFILYVGVVVENSTTPGNKDLVIRSALPKQL